MTHCHTCSKHDDHATPSYMLPMDVVPYDENPRVPGYVVLLEPTIGGANSGFKGMVTISIMVNNPVSEFPINSVDLDLKYVSVTDSTGVSVKPTLEEDKENQLVWLCLDRPLSRGVGTVTIFYNGKFNAQLRGFYLSEYQDQHGETQYIASTQSQPADFRRWVPSFDQPGPTGYKSRFQLSVSVEKDLTVRSNAAIMSEGLDPLTSKKLVTFEPTNRLPTYVFAVAIGKLESSPPAYISNVEVRIWATPGKTELMKFAVRVLEDALPMLEEFHGVDYPNMKLDLIAVPNFAFGAMENDGMFIFREEALLVDESKASVAQLARVAEIVIHETDHTWDGNRITMMDWSQLSLNELRATFMANLISDRIFPEWGVWERFAQARSGAMGTDGLSNTRPIVSAINRIEECESIVDDITYHKGASVLRQGQMFLESVIPGGFASGMQYFNQLYGSGNATTAQLWDAIGKETGFGFRQFMDLWMLQPGFPLVSVRRTGANTVLLKQDLFRYLASDSDSEEKENTLWQIPVFIRHYKGGEAVEQTFLLNSREKTFELSDDFDWLVVNAGGHGFYRVHYDGALKTETLLHLSELRVVERFNLINDSWAMVLAGNTSVSSHLHLISAYSQETDPNVWRIIGGSLLRIREISSENDQRRIRQLGVVLAATHLERLGWQAKKSDTTLDCELRGIIIDLLGELEVEGIKEQATRIYKSWLHDSGSVDPDVFAACLKVLAYGGDEVMFDEFAKQLKRALSPQQITVFLRALCCFPDNWLAAKTFALVLNGSIKAQMGGTVLNLLMSNARVRGQTWRSIKSHLPELTRLLPTILLMRALEGARYLDNEADTADIVSFFAENRELLFGSEKNIAQTIEWHAINSNLKRALTAGIAGLFEFV